MVYCGKPSRGCQMCRARRIKCDETKPTCNQCAKSRRQCPGYKDEFDLVFRNETKATERRAQKANRKIIGQKFGKHDYSPEASSSSSSSSSSDSISPIGGGFLASPDSEGFMRSLELPTDQLATCHFVSNFILLPREGSTRGFMEYLIPLLKAETRASHLTAAFNACALASLGNRVYANGYDFGDRALSEYTRALALTHHAIKDPKLSKADSTVATVLLLGLFENISAKQLGVFGWGSHTEGAVHLIKSRGRSQLKTKTGLLLFIAVRTQMIVQTQSTGKMPIMGADWWVTGDSIRVEVAGLSQRIAIQTAELRAEVTGLMSSELVRTPAMTEKMNDIIRRAQAVDEACEEWMRTLPDAWTYRTVAWEDHVPGGDFSKAEVFPGRVDVYGDFYMASVWNMVRVNRLILASVIVRCAAWVCAPVDYRTTREYAASARVCVDMITDILATVPYHLGWHIRRRHLLRDQLSGFACGDDDSLKGLAGYFLTWPLACVNGQDYTTDSQRAWVLGRLRYISAECGIRYAQTISQLNLRIPSMLIRRDALMAQTSYTMPQNLDKDKLLAARAAPPTAGYAMNPIQQREAMQKVQLDQKKAELVKQASGNNGEKAEQEAKKRLSIV